MPIQRIRYWIFAWVAGLALSGPACAATYPLDGDVVGEASFYKVQRNDTLAQIARHVDVGLVELLAANPGIGPKNLRAGSTLTLPTRYVLPDAPHEGVVINLAQLRLFYFPGDGSVMTFPIGIGRDNWETPTGRTSITLKRKDPVWIPPDSIREEEPNLPDIVPAGPDNPLGLFALNLGWPGYRIHGTNRPYSVGKRASHGCIRLYPEDIELLFGAVRVGLPVTVVNAPYLLGWRENKLWLSVMPALGQEITLAKYGKPQPVELPGIDDAVRAAAGEGAAIQWQTVRETVAAHLGLPAVIVTEQKHKLPWN